MKIPECFGEFNLEHIEKEQGKCMDCLLQNGARFTVNCWKWKDSPIRTRKKKGIFLGLLSYGIASTVYSYALNSILGIVLGSVLISLVSFILTFGYYQKRKIFEQFQYERGWFYGE